MRVSLRGLEWIQNTALGLMFATVPLAACTADTGDGVAQSGDPLKGGVPANDHGKGKAGKGEAGAASGGTDTDAGPGTVGGKTQKPKKDKTHGGKAESGAGGQAADDDVNADEGAAENP